jgi:hypothetical protein
LIWLLGSGSAKLTLHEATNATLLCTKNSQNGVVGGSVLPVSALSPSFSRTDSTSLRSTSGEMKGTVMGGCILGGGRRRGALAASVVSVAGAAAASAAGAAAVSAAGAAAVSAAGEAAVSAAGAAAVSAAEAAAAYVAGAAAASAAGAAAAFTADAATGSAAKAAASSAGGETAAPVSDGTEASPEGGDRVGLVAVEGADWVSLGAAGWGGGVVSSAASSRGCSLKMEN